MSHSSTAFAGSCIDQHLQTVAYFCSWGASIQEVECKHTATGCVLGEVAEGIHMITRAGPKRSGLDAVGQTCGTMSTLRLCAAAVDNPAAGEAPTAAVQGCWSAKSRAQTGTHPFYSGLPVCMQPASGALSIAFRGDGGCDGIIRSLHRLC